MSDKNRPGPMRYSEGIDGEALTAEKERQFRRGLDAYRDAVYADRIRKLGGDPEVNHPKADEILCELLESLGYVETVRAFRALPKWYS